MQYHEQEVCYFLEGEIEVTPPEGGDAVKAGKGDLVTFPAGMACTWKVLGCAVEPDSREVTAEAASESTNKVAKSLFLGNDGGIL